MTRATFNVQLVDWLTHEAALRAIRTTVFIREQQVPEDLEWDGEDRHAHHALATDVAGTPIGTARLILHGSRAHIGRMAVLRDWRGQGVGARLLARLIEVARDQGATEAFLNAQTYAIPFYERYGFVREGEEFLDAGIPHYRMSRALESPSMEGCWQFWVDRGGTFTDIVAKRPDGRLVTHKLLSENPGHYSDAALQGMRELMQIPSDQPLPAEQIAAIKMGTTLGTNALLERNGARVALVTTRGLSDAIQIGYQNRPDIFALHIQRPPMLYTAVVEAQERVCADGTVEQPLDRDHLREALRSLRTQGIDALAIVFMHGYRYPEHERQAAVLARELGFAHVAVSHEVSPLIKLVARGETTLVDAYLTPLIAQYVQQLHTGLGGTVTQFQFMQSHGGLIDAQTFRGRDCLLSGPAGGIAGAVKVSQTAGFDKIITFDMGGTSTDVAHYCGEFERSFDTEIAGCRLRVPMLHIHTVAAGGGSMLHFDGRRFAVGPDSAGAHPGPACYRRGGPLTVTDANLLLGRLQPEFFPRVFGVDGKQPLDAETVQLKFAELTMQVSRETGQTQTAEQVAEGFLAVAVENMAEAIKKISLARGIDVSDYALCCFGGAGGQTACRVADAIGIPSVLLHPLAGVLSAYGMGLADQRVLLEQAFEAPLDASLLPELETALQTLSVRGMGQLEAQGMPTSTLEMQCRLQLKYTGSDSVLPVVFEDIVAMRAAFESAHRQQFGFAEPGKTILVEAMMVEVIGRTAERVTATALAATASPTSRTASMYCSGVWQPVPVYLRAELYAGQYIPGPAIIMEPTATIVVEPEWQAEVRPQGEIVLTRSVPLPTRVAVGTRCDPVQLEIFNQRFMAIAEEMGLVLARTAHSVNIKERLDFSCALFNAEGELIANAPHIPVHLGSMGESVRAIRARFAQEMRVGDVYLLNSPYHGGTHLPDITVITPVFDAAGQRVLFYTASRGHHADVGGISPGSMPPNSRHIDEEGVWSAGLRIVAQGGFLETDIRAWLADNPHPARKPEQNLADLKAQIAANEKGAQELRALVARYSLETVQAYMAHALDHGEAAVRAAIATLKDGQFALTMDNGAQIKVRVTIDHIEQCARIDFTGTSAQQPNNFNAPAAICKAAVLYVFRTLVAQAIPLNAGCMRPLEIVIPEGSLLNPVHPAAVVAGNVETSMAICDCLYGALGVLAASQGTMNNFTFGDAEHQYYETLCGGAGAGPDFEGADAVHTHMTNSRLTDPEVLEQRFPVVLEEFTVRTGSGGMGKYRGGDGVVRQILFLQPMQAGILSERRVQAPFGLGGGVAGASGVNQLRRADGEVETLTGCATVAMQAGDVFVIMTPGGGGYGGH